MAKGKKIRSILEHLQTEVPDATPVMASNAEEEAPDDEGDFTPATESTQVTGTNAKKKKKPSIY